DPAEERAYLLTNLGLMTTPRPPPRRSGTRPPGDLMKAISFEAEDHRKFAYALVARDIRRVTALVHHTDIDDQTRTAIDAGLEQLEVRTWATLLHDPVSGVLIRDSEVYSDGRPVITTIDWRDGFATLVQHKHAGYGEDVEVINLSSVVAVRL